MSELEAQRPFYADQVVEEGGVMSDQMNKFIDQLMRSVGGLSESVESLSSNIAALATRIDVLEALYDDDWHEIGAGGEPAFQNSWTNNDVNSTSAAFKVEANIVYIKGLVKGGSANSTIFNLPEAYRPSKNIYISTATNTSTTNTPRILISSNGNVLPQGSFGNWVSIHVCFSLD